VRICDSAAALSRVAAGVVLDTAVAAVARRGRCAVALSGGTTPRALYHLLADPLAPFRVRTPWPGVHLFWGDERWVPRDHPDSNYRMVSETLLRSISIPGHNVHPIPTDYAEPAAAAARYETELRSFFGTGGEAPPRFDLILLGLGDDGHTASLFPGSEALDERHRLVLAPWAEAQRSFRVTLTPPVLNAARLAVFLVSGAAKAQALQAVLEGARDPQRYPAQVVAAERTLWLADRDAAALLSSSI
jgi:6-phosphogluconolactonase